MRSWPGLAAIGAGLVHLGIAAGSPPLQLIAFLVPGAAEVLWGVLALARPESARPRAALGVLAVLVALQVVLLVASGHHHGAASTAASSASTTAAPLGAVAGAAVLDLVTAVLLAVRIRRGSDGTAMTGPLRFLLGTAAGAAVVAAVTVTSLAGTAVGAHHVH